MSRPFYVVFSERTSMEENSEREAIARARHVVETGRSSWASVTRFSNGRLGPEAKVIARFGDHERDPKRSTMRRYPPLAPLPRGRAKVEKVLHEFKGGKLRSSGGRKVKSRRQAIAIALSEQRKKEHLPVKRDARAKPPKIRVERGPTGAAVWHLGKTELLVYWGGPGSRLRIGTNRPGTSLAVIEHPSASDTYYTFREANLAVRRFLKS